MSKELIAAIEQVSREKGIDPGYLIEAIEDAVLTASRRLARPKERLSVRLDRQEGTIHLWVRKRVVESVRHPEVEIPIEEAQRWKPGVQVGEEVEVPYPGELLSRLKAVQIAKRVILHKVREAERQKIARIYKDQVGRIVTGTVKAVWKGDVTLDLPDTEALLPKEFQLPRDRFERGQYVRALLVKVYEHEEPQLVVSRVHPDFIYRLMEMEIEEVFKGLVEVVRIVREPGERAKVAVYSKHPHIDPVGACVGVKGTRIQAIMNELHGERIDVIQWSDNVCEFAANALKPAKVLEVHVLDEEERVLEAVVADDQLSIAIGKNGQNVKLASRLVGWRIEVIRASEKEGQFGVTPSVEEFYRILRTHHQIDEGLIQQMIERGYDRLMPLIQAGIADLMEVPGMTPETARTIKEALRAFTRGRYKTQPTEPTTAASS
jgi:N utilization substance protein A